MEEVTAVDLLMSVLAWLLWLVAGLIGLVLAVLCVPLRAAVAADNLALPAGGELVAVDEGGDVSIAWPEGDWRWDIHWLFGLIRWSGTKVRGAPAESRMQVLGKTVRPRARMPGRPGRDKGRHGRRWRFGRRTPGEDDLAGKPAGARKRRSRRGLSLADVRTLWPDVRWLLGSLRRAGTASVRGDLVYGFDDPALTGWCEVMRAVAPLPRGLAVTPDFLGLRLSGKAAAQLTVYPIRGVAAAGRFLLRPAVRRWWRQRRQRPFAGRASAARRVAHAG